jgi:hypothetical protein
MDFQHIVITANGKGTRMAKYEVPKFMLPYQGKPIIHHLMDRFPNAIVLTHHRIDNLPIYKCEPTNSRKETLAYLDGWKNTLILDSDIIVKGAVEKPKDKDCVYTRDGINAGLYFAKDITNLLHRMNGCDVVSGMESPDYLHCATIHLGTENEYEHHCS